MSLRLLVMAAQADHLRLVRKHVEIEWPDATVSDHRLGVDAPLDAGFAATGFDAVVIVTAASGESTQNLVDELLAKPEFAPIVLLTLEDAPAVEPPARAGLYRSYGRKIDRVSLLAALRDASALHRQFLARMRARPDFDQRYRFGDLVIRGHRCIKQVGSGGMCTIYLAESERAGGVVVLKVFRQVPDVSERLVSFDRFLQEYEIVAGLNHRNIVRIFDLGIADDHAYIAMEHFPAGDLRERMKAPLSGAVALEYLRQIASSLDAIHSVGVLHRDLKPANIMLRGDGSVCLIDFGLAKANAFEVDLTGAREIFGTPYYMSPEQGHAEPIDARSDLYSLGVIFYEMLTGRKPYKGHSAMEVIYKHRRAALPTVPPQFQEFEPLLHRLLAKAPNDRFQTARELLDATDAIKVSA
jgi:tRNA A-37 threonylcarbamoyl transferase component Bud32